MYPDYGEETSYEIVNFDLKQQCLRRTMSDEDIGILSVILGERFVRPKNLKLEFLAAYNRSSPHTPV